MLSRLNAAPWLEANADQQQHQHLALPSFKSMLDIDNGDEDWYIAGASESHQFDPFHAHHDPKDAAFTPISAPHDALLLPHPPSMPTHGDSQPFSPPKASISSIFGSDCSIPFDNAGFGGLGCDAPSLFSSALIGGGDGGGSVGADALLGLSGVGQFGCPILNSGGGRLLPFPENCSNLNSGGVPGGFNPMPTFDSFENSPSLNRVKMLQPLEIFPTVGAQPTLFQKRAAAALRQNLAVGSDKGGIFGLWNNGESLQGSHGRVGLEIENEKRRRGSEDEGIVDEGSFDASGLNYDSDEDAIAENSLQIEESGRSAGGGNNGNCSVTGNGDQKGKKKGPPAKNLMAERRRRKKLNDRLYMLRSVVPNISKMDRASILGDAIEYLKELLQRINDLHNELESTPPSSALIGATAPSFHPPLTPSPLTLPSRVKEDLCPSSLPSPNNQAARVEVRVREGQAVNIHMFCARRPGLLLSVMRALDGLGLEIQQAVISCFNGFALDVFRAEQCKDGPGSLPDEIKSVLLHSAGFL